MLVLRLCIETRASLVLIREISVSLNDYVLIFAPFNGLIYALQKCFFLRSGSVVNRPTFFGYASNIRDVNRVIIESPHAIRYLVKWKEAVYYTFDID